MLAEEIARYCISDELGRELVRWLRAIACAVDDQSHAGAHAIWISGPPGSGKTTLAHLLGYALDGATLPDGTALFSALQTRADPHFASELADAWAALLGRIDSMAIVLNVRAQEPLLPTVLDRVERRLEVPGSSRAGTSPKDVVEALHAMTRARAPDQTLFVFLDDLGPRLREDAKLRRLVASFLGHLSGRLRGRLRVIATSDDELPEIDDDSPLAELAELFPPDLRLSLTATMVTEIARRRLRSTPRENEPTLRSIFRKHRSEIFRYALSGEETSEDDFVDFFPAQKRQIDLMQAVATATRKDHTRDVGPGGDRTPGVLSILAEALQKFEHDKPRMGNLLPLEAVCDRLGPSFAPEVEETLTRLIALDDSVRPAQATRIARIVAGLERIQEQTPVTADLLRRSLYDRIGGGDPHPRLEQTIEWLKGAGYLTHSRVYGYQIHTASASTWALWRSREDVTRQESSEIVREMLRDLLARIPVDATDVEFPWDALYGDGSLAHDVRLLVPTSADAVIVNLLHLPRHRRSTAEWQARSTWARIKDRLHWVAEGDPEVVLEISVDLARARRMLDAHGDPRMLRGERPRLLLHERTRLRDLEVQMREAVQKSFLEGTFYFRGVAQSARVFGSRFDAALIAAMRWVRPDLA